MKSNLIISISASEDKILLNIFEQDFKPFTNIFETNFNELKKITDEINLFIERYYLKSAGSNKKLITYGKLLYYKLFPKGFDYKLEPEQAIIFSIDKRLISIPFEIIYDNNFWCLKYQIVRQIKHSKTTADYKLNKKFKAIILSNPTEDKQIEESLRYERDTIYKILHSTRNISIDFPYAGRSINKQFFLNGLIENNIIYYSGHTNPNKILLYNSSLTPNDIKHLNLPHIFLLFLNSCKSSMLKTKKNFEDSLLYNFLNSGVKNHIGSLHDIRPIPASLFGIKFFKNLKNNYSIGMAILKARRTVYKKYGLNEISWFSYNFYGNPKDKISFKFKFSFKAVIPAIILMMGLIFFTRLNKPIMFPKKSLAILPLVYNNKSLSDYSADKTAELYKHFKTKYKLVEREKLNKIIKELKMGRTMFIDKQKAMKIGKIIPANLLLYGRVYKINNKIKVTYRIIDVSTSEVVFIK